MRRYSAAIWPLISQLVAVAVVLSVRPTPEIELSVEESAGLSFAYVLLVFGMALLMVFLVRKRLYKVIRYFITAFFVYSSFIALDTLIYPFVQISWPVELLISVLIAWLSLRRDIAGNIAKSFLAASLAFLFVSFFNDLFIYFLLTGLAIYDTYSVFRGPLSELLMVSDRPEDPLEPLMMFHGDVSMGLGDVFCYSMATATSFRSLSPFEALVPMMALNAGIIITLWALYRTKRSLPGLTIPTILWLLSQLVIQTCR